MLTQSDVVLAQPEPGLSPQALIERARALRPYLLERQDETDERGTYSPETDQKFKEAGFYRLFLPRRFGGYECDVPTYTRVISAIARGCPGTAWCLALASGHALQLSAWFGEQAQVDALSPNGDFAAPTRGVPRGTAERTATGWRIEGTWDYCSGSPYSTHAMVWARTVGEPGPPQVKLALVPRDQFELLDDWRGRAFGMRGSGSNSIRVDGAEVPEHFVIDDPFPFSPDPNTPGYLLHGNPMYSVPAMMIFPLEITAVLVGTARAALDEYERIITTKAAPAPHGAPVPAERRTLAATHGNQRWYGLATGRVGAAEALLAQLSEELMETCRRAAEDGKGFDLVDAARFGLVRQQAVNLGWEAVDLMYRTSGTSEGGRIGSRMNRYYRDYTMGRTNIVVDEENFSENYAQTYFGTALA